MRAVRPENVRQANWHGVAWHGVSARVAASCTSAALATTRRAALLLLQQLTDGGLVDGADLREWGGGGGVLLLEKWLANAKLNMDTLSHRAQCLVSYESDHIREGCSCISLYCITRPGGGMQRLTTVRPVSTVL